MTEMTSKGSFAPDSRIATTWQVNQSQEINALILDLKVDVVVTILNLISHNGRDIPLK